jgi:catechol 2,3-dioxygenase-like lactoylglutathione lyase family enzyme
MKIKITSLYVDDQDKALRFYTEVLGFAKKLTSVRAHIVGLPWFLRRSPMGRSCNWR